MTLFISYYCFFLVPLLGKVVGVGGVKERREAGEIAANFFFH